MTDEKKFNILLQILSNEQQILQRSDQKAYTLLSILGVYSVFFIIHYTKIPPSFFSLLIVFLFFTSVLISISFLVLVLSPRVRKVRKTAVSEKAEAPIFFGGIVKYKTHADYSLDLNTLLNNSEETYSAFSQSVYSVGKINAFKNKYLKYGIISFVIAVLLEFIVIVSLYFNLAIFGKHL